MLGEGTVRRERGRRGQDGKGVINGGRAARRMDEEGEMEHRRECVKLLCTSLTSWTESAQLLNREMGKTDTHMHKLLLVSLSHTPADQHPCTFMRVFGVFVPLCDSYLCF